MLQRPNEKLQQKVTLYKDKIRSQLKKKIVIIKDQMKLRHSKIQLDTPSQKQSNIAADFSDNYELGEKLGEGAHAIVHKAIRKCDNQEFAVKIFRSSDPEIIASIRKTYQIGSMLQHPNLIKVKELYINQQNGYSYQIMELCQYPNLESQINNLNLNEIKTVMRELLNGILYMHKQKICHRDIKPDNILFDGQNVKLLDFGVSKKFYVKQHHIDMWTPTGTQFYCAPEIYTKVSYTYKVDIWSVGVILYQLLTKELPFQDETAHGTIELICKAQFKDHPALDKVSKDLLSRLLWIDPKKRFNADEALKHLWFQNKEIKQQCMDDMIVHDGLVNNSSLIIQLSQSQNRNTYANNFETKVEAFMPTIHVKQSSFRDSS
ncbi:unnamed protein product (macronuclear) [Paramecium tetraurelia]|uniref:Protein kinase domain-containing protein n=1 Tax=Paramecium tetraurelia TaxID=5888 RepID=A0BF74_PARTE|nr:uncharacterized protein GSPATT00028226001 [Paramecium tetraurelia]CAK57191.1 unnamed protein product [Paramecium tetraurelia]|eukprot:XP_001424589.1 hypothetical protein (macronuclear) [Paramecium tetraurelia strain d4-2]